VGHYSGGHPGFDGGYRGRYGGRGGYGWRRGYGWRGRYGWRGGYGDWGWGWGGLAVGLYFARLPFYCSTLWGADGGTYYYADDTYFQWDSSVGQYETVNPPLDVQREGARQSPDLIAYPKNAQTESQQALDSRECHAWAQAQSGFDPANPPQTLPPTAPGTTSKRADYMRAQAACFEGRGYSVQ